VLLTQFEIRHEVALYAARQGKASGLTTIVNPTPVPEEPTGGYEAADYLTPNGPEARQMLGMAPDQQTDPLQMAAALREQSGAGCVIITLGDQGVAVAEASGGWTMPAPAVTAVDATGAGDAFNGTLALGLARGLPLRQAVGNAILVGAYSVTQQGTIPIFPTVNKVSAFLAEVLDKEDTYTWFQMGDTS
jgi:ribokinase